MGPHPFSQPKMLEGNITARVTSRRRFQRTAARVTSSSSCRNPNSHIRHLVMEHLAQGEDIQMRPNSAHLLNFLEERKYAVEVLHQGMTSYHSTEDMYEDMYMGLHQTGIR